MIDRVWSGIDPGLHGCIVALGPENDQPIFWHDWKMPSVAKDDSIEYARRLGRLEMRVNSAMLGAEIFGTRDTRHFVSNQCRQFFLMYSSYYNSANIFPLMDAAACLQATLSRFGQVFKENDTTVRKKFISDGANKPESKLACALTSRRLLTEGYLIDNCACLTWETKVKSPKPPEARALDFLDAYVAALVCKYQWLTGEYYDLMRRKECLALALGVKRALTWRDIEAYQKEKAE